MFYTVRCSVRYSEHVQQYLTSCTATEYTFTDFFPAVLLFVFVFSGGGLGGVKGKTANEDQDMIYRKALSKLSLVWCACKPLLLLLLLLSCASKLEGTFVRQQSCRCRAG